MKTYALDKPTNQRRLIIIISSIVVLIAAVSTMVYLLPSKTQDVPMAIGQPEEAGPVVESVEGRYLFSGTVVIARGIEDEARTSSGIDYDQPFSKFSTFKPQQYDAWEFDHECPMTLNNIPFSTQASNTIFNCRPEFIPAMQKHFPNIIANVANNHTQDMGVDGYEETVKHLERSGVQTIGNYSPRVKEDICEVVALPVRLQKSDGTETKGTLPAAFCAWHYFSFEPKPDEYRVVEEYASVMPLFAFVQVGAEYRSEPDSRQVSVARSLIDTGAPEFVIENSTHWVQPTEVYKGKLVVYSTGNFIFDQLDYETNRSLSIDMTMTIPYDDNVAKWLELGESCKKRHDNCLEKALETGLEKIQTSLKYDVVGGQTGYRKLTQKAGPALQKAIEERADWLKTLKALGQN